LSDSIQTRKKTLRNTAIGTTFVILLLVSIFLTRDYVNKEIYCRDREITDLRNQVSTLQGYLAENGTQLLSLNNMITNLSDSVDRLVYDNEQLTQQTQTKQYQLNLAWHEIYVLRNQTARLESQITELKRQIYV